MHLQSNLKSEISHKNKPKSSVMRKTQQRPRLVTFFSSFRMLSFKVKNKQKSQY